MALAPDPQFPERAPNVYERKFGDSPAGAEGPTRFEEGLATDQDVPADFILGIQQGQAIAPGRPNRNARVDTKGAAETMKQRAHAGSAAWVDAPTFLREFVQGSFTDYAEVHYEEVVRDGSRMQRVSPAQVND